MTTAVPFDPHASKGQIMFSRAGKSTNNLYLAF